ncbi:hypothetical protein P8C59_007985 [Phyllachora maydis]|uniref:C2H2 type master regulator of conidiophore development brlA n=1 Tax=Phyllachora maydis TaxID=1825666 RepID=A0AAD9I9N3_9PEZI|nr:hypothetical protein P8C59_007985 [Phyllachora maydis]
MANPACQSPMPFGTYQGYHSPPSSVASSPLPYGAQYDEPQPVHLPAPEPQRKRSSPRSLKADETNRSGSVDSQGLPSSKSVVPRTITSNEPDDPKNKIAFDTPIDRMMAAIQAREATARIIQTQEAKMMAETPDGQSLPTAMESLDISQSGRDHSSADVSPRTLKRKGLKYQCSHRNCRKMFGQKQHLATHERAHNGDRPFICKVCNTTFSQKGNLTTHLRNHEGLRPFACSWPGCEKTFAQKGNLNSHYDSIHLHKNKHPCYLGDCERVGKTFSARGNLKSHMNKAHVDEVASLTEKFSRVLDINTLSSREQKLFEVFAVTFKNSNKGIRGRGLGRRVQPPKEKSQPSPPTPPPSPPAEYNGMRTTSSSSLGQPMPLPSQNPYQHHMHVHALPQPMPMHPHGAVFQQQQLRHQHQHQQQQYYAQGPSQQAPFGGISFPGMQM